MKFYEPFQRLSFLYFKGNSSVYVKSATSFYLPAGVSLIGRDTLFDDSFEATLKFSLTINNAITEPYTFEQERAILFFDNEKLAGLTDTTVIKETLGNLISINLEAFRFCLVTCEIYNERGVKTGQVTNTIAQDGEVIIL